MNDRPSHHLDHQETPGLPRIVCLAPGAADMLAAWGLSASIRGCSHACRAPGATTLTRPGPQGWSLDHRAVLDLHPQALVTATPEAGCHLDPADVGRLVRELGPTCRHIHLAPTSLEEVIDASLTLGSALGVEGLAREAAVAWRARMHHAEEFVNPYADAPPAIVLESDSPLRVSGLWLPQLLERAGASSPLNPCEAKPGSGAAMGPQAAERVAGPARLVTDHDLARIGPCWLILAPQNGEPGSALAMARRLQPRPWWGSATTQGLALLDADWSPHRTGPSLAQILELLVAWCSDRPELLPEAGQARLVMPADIPTLPA